MDDYTVRNHCGLITDTNYCYSVAGDRECEVNLPNLTKFIKSETFKNSVVIQTNYQLFNECIPRIPKESYLQQGLNKANNLKKEEMFEYSVQTKILVF